MTDLPDRLDPHLIAAIDAAVHALAEGGENVGPTLDAIEAMEAAVLDAGAPAAQERWASGILACLADTAVQRARQSQTARVSASEARSTAGRLATMLEHSPVGFAFLDTDCRYLLVNEPLAAINGWSVEEHLGRTAEDVLGDVWPSVAPVFEKVLMTGVAVPGVEVSGQIPSTPGLERTWIASYYPVMDDDGRIEGVAVVIEEITDRRLAERAARLVTNAAELGWAVPNVASAVEAIVGLPIPELGDVCVLATATEGGLDVTARRMVGDTLVDHPVATSGDARNLIAQALATATTAADLVGGGDIPLWPGVAPAPAIATPLRIGGRVIGALGVASTDNAGRRYRASDIIVLEDLSGRLAQVLEHARLSEQAAASEARWRLVASASALVESELDTARRADRLAQLLVPELADGACVFLLDDGQLRLVITAHVRADVAETLAAVRWPALDLAGVTGLDDGGTVVFTPAPGLVVGEGPDGHAVDMVALIGTSSALVAPLRLGRELIGALVLGRGPSRPRFGPADTDVARELSRIAAPALTNAQRFEHERATAEKLQRSLLPQQLPDVPGVEVAARYLPGSAELQVGGDWYDVLAPAETPLFVIGDVVGHSIDAAVTMGRYRIAVQFMAQRHDDPAALIANVDAFMGSAYPDGMATLLAMTYDPVRGRLVAASAGHLPPLVIAPNGETSFFALEPGPPLGVGRESGYQSIGMEVAAGSRVVLFTDGLIERRTDLIDIGMARLAEVARSVAGTVHEVADGIIARLVAREPDDDVALLVVHLGVARDELDLWLAPDTGSLGVARRALRRWLINIGAADADDVLVAVHEAVANAVEHPYHEAVARPVRVSAGVDGDDLWVRVADQGQWRDPSGARESRGRGLAIMRSVIRDVAVATGPAGTTATLKRGVWGNTSP